MPALVWKKRVESAIRRLSNDDSNIPTEQVRLRRNSIANKCILQAVLNTKDTLVLTEDDMEMVHIKVPSACVAFMLSTGELGSQRQQLREHSLLNLLSNRRQL